MFKGIGQMASLVKQAQEMQGRMKELQAKLQQLRVEGSAGGGMVTIEMTGEQKVIACRIEKSLFAAGDQEMLEDLVVIATNNALDRIKEASAVEMQKLTGGMDLSALGDTFSKLGLGG